MTSAAWLTITLLLLLGAPPVRAQLTFCCPSTNDLYQLIPSAQRFDSAASAIDHAAEGSGVLILADGYPKQQTEISSTAFDSARAKRLRLYIEYPATLSGFKFDKPRGT